eukprot:TRINITY_DN7619_c0_g3_i2.p1 TRINITY_DN7619_c0_g3~~TRINITY_DN7619_c0_g3_i2.p1  ORF type:complete len:1134 (+),score=237.25 TRINITY_DN7619_c0_g3_i2:158-3559(+)
MPAVRTSASAGALGALLPRTNGNGGRAVLRSSASSIVVGGRGSPAPRGTLALQPQSPPAAGSLRASAAGRRATFHSGEPSVSPTGSPTALRSSGPWLSPTAAARSAGAGSRRKTAAGGLVAAAPFAASLLHASADGVKPLPAQNFAKIATAAVSAKGGQQRHRQQQQQRHGAVLIADDAESALGGSDLVSQLQDKSSEVRTAAIDTLVALGQSAVLSHGSSLANLLHDNCPVVRIAAAQALGGLKEAGAAYVAPLASLLDDKHPTVRYLALEALTFLPGAGDVLETRARSLEAMLSSEDFRVREVAAAAFGTMKPDVAAPYCPAVAALLHDSNATVRRIAVKALANLGQSMMRPFFTKIAALLRDTDRDVRLAVFDALGDAGPSCVASMIDELQHAQEEELEFRALLLTEPLVDFKSIATPHLVRMLSRETRGIACRCLWILDEHCLLTRHADPAVRLLSLTVLAKMRSVAANHVESIIDFLSSTDAQLRTAAIEVFVRIGDSVLERMVELLSDNNALARQSAVTVLGSLGAEIASAVSQAAVSPIAGAVAPLLWDARGEVRTAARAALNAMGPAGAEHLAAADATPQLDVACAKSFEHGILRLAAERQGWRISEGSGGAVVWVHGKDNMIERLMNLRPDEFLSHVPALGALTLKVPLAEILREAGADFWPHSWCVPESAGEGAPWTRPLQQQQRPAALQQQRGRVGQSVASAAAEAFAGAPTTVIVKPSGGSCGKGIALARSSDELHAAVAALPERASVVVQVYVDPPLLLNGHKWDARVYVLLMPEFCESDDGADCCGSKRSIRLRAFLSREGLARVCVDPYEPAGPRNLHRATSHLTNYSLSKLSERFVHSEDPSDPDRGSKRSLSSVLWRLEAGPEAARTVKMDVEGQPGLYSGAFDLRGRAHGAGVFRYDEGGRGVFVGAFAEGLPVRGARYDAAAALRATMDSGKWTFRADAELAAEFPAPTSESSHEASEDAGRYERSDFWSQLRKMVRQTADALAEPLLATVLDPAHWDGNESVANAAFDALPRCFHVIVQLHAAFFHLFLCFFPSSFQKSRLWAKKRNAQSITRAIARTLVASSIAHSLEYLYIPMSSVPFLPFRPRLPPHRLRLSPARRHLQAFSHLHYSCHL